VKLWALALAAFIAISALPLAPAAAQPQPYNESLTFATVEGLTYGFKLSFHSLPAENLTAPLASLLAQHASLQALRLEVSRRPSPAAEGQLWAQLQPYSSLLGLGEVPAAGLYLKALGNLDDVRGLVSELNAHLNLSLVEMGEGEYYSPVQHDDLIRAALWQLVPRSGLGSLVRQDDFLGLPYSRLVLSYASASRSWNLTLIGFSNVALGARFSLSTAFPVLASRPVNASGAGASVSFLFLGSLLENASGLSYMNDPSTLSARAELMLSPGQRLPNANFTMETSFPVLLATRDIDSASLKAGDVVEVRVLVKNVAPLTAPSALNVTLRESWWRPYFELVLGNASLSVPRLQPGGEVTLAYRLRVKTNESITLYADEGPVMYQYKVGGQLYSAGAALNGFPVHLNRDEGSLVITLEPSSTQPGWGPLNATVRIRNAGTRAVIGAAGNGTQLPDLLPGQATSLTVTLLPPSFGDARLRSFVSFTWPTTFGELRASSNHVALLMDQAAPLLPRPSLGISVRGLGGQVLNVTFTLLNAQGGQAMDRYSLFVPLPQGLAALRTNFTSGAAGLSAQGTLAPGKSISYFALLNSSEPLNYVLPPPLLGLGLGALNFTYRGEGYGLPAGVLLQQLVQPAQGFVGLNFTASFTVENRGPLPIFGLALQVNAGPLGFTSNASLVRGNLSAGERWNLSGVLRPSKEGSFSLAGSKLSFFFAGRTYTLNATQPANFTAYSPPSVRLEAPQGVLEGSSFILTVVVANPSPLPVGDIRVLLKGVPPYLKLSSTSLEIGGLAGNSMARFNISAQLTAPFDATIPPPEATFSYLGARLQAASSGTIIAAQEMVLVRYALPLLAGLALVLGVVWGVRRATSPSPPGRTVGRPPSPRGTASAREGA
jgi:hypothetical protein